MLGAIRIAVEWGLGSVTISCSHGDFAREQKLVLYPTGMSEQYMVAYLVAKARACFYGIRHSKNLSYAPPGSIDPLRLSEMRGGWYWLPLHEVAGTACGVRACR